MVEISVVKEQVENFIEFNKHNKKNYDNKVEEFLKNEKATILENDCDSYICKKEYKYTLKDNNEIAVKFVFSSLLFDIDIDIDELIYDEKYKEYEDDIRFCIYENAKEFSNLYTMLLDNYYEKITNYWNEIGYEIDFDEYFTKISNNEYTIEGDIFSDFKDLEITKL